MVAERTEDLAIRGVLPLTIGGETVELRTLVIDESDAWMRKLALALAELQGVPEPEDDQEGADLIAALLTSSTSAAVALLHAYDIDDALAGIEVGKRATKQELKAALMAMVTVEDPFGEAAARSATAALGERSHLLGLFLAALGDTELWQRSERSTNGSSAPTESTTDTSVRTGVTSRSPSAGRTRKPRKKKT